MRPGLVNKMSSVIFKTVLFKPSRIVQTSTLKGILKRCLSFWLTPSMYCLEIRSFNNLLEFPWVPITPLVNKPILFLYEPEFIKILEREKKNHSLSYHWYDYWIGPCHFFITDSCFICNPSKKAISKTYQANIQTNLSHYGEK